MLSSCHSTLAFPYGRRRLRLFLNAIHTLTHTHTCKHNHFLYIHICWFGSCIWVSCVYTLIYGIITHVIVRECCMWALSNRLFMNCRKNINAYIREAWLLYTTAYIPGLAFIFTVNIRTVGSHTRDKIYSQPKWGTSN